MCGGVVVQCRQVLRAQHQRRIDGVALDHEGGVPVFACGFQQRHALVEPSVIAGRLQPHLCVAARDIGGRHLVSGRAGGASFQRVVGEVFDVRLDAQCRG
jgi:hypothetical protein